MDESTKAKLQPGDVAIVYAGSSQGAFEWATWDGESWVDTRYTDIGLPTETHMQLFFIEDTAYWRPKPAQLIAESFTKMLTHYHALEPEVKAMSQTQEAFKELFEAIQKKFGPITDIHFCTSFEGSQAFQEASEEPYEELEIEEYPELTEEEAAEELNISEEWLTKLLQENTLPSLRCSDVMAYKKQRGNKA